MVRDEEIQRLINYIKGLGLKVSFSSKKEAASAHWCLDNSEIIIYKKNNTTKIETVLSLIHEIGHALHNIHEKNRKIDPRLEKAIDHVAEAAKSETDVKRRQAKVLLNDEINGASYWHVIYAETNMKFPIWKLEAQMEFDVWQYEVSYETGRDARKKDRVKKLKELINKHRNKSNG